MKELQEFKTVIRAPYAWPGGYEIALYFKDGERICVSCAKDNWKEIVDDTQNGWGQWQAGFTGVHWEGPADFCCQCNKEMPTEYGEDIQTPWGKSQHSREIAVGVVFYSTSSHGGIRVSKEKAEMLSPQARELGWAFYSDGALWYEEDCLYAVPLYDVPEWGEAAKCIRAGLENTIRGWYPEYFE